MEELRIDVYEDDDSQGIAQDIIKALTFDLVQPVRVEGKLRFDDGEINIEMSNGDFIELRYDIREKHTKYWLYINTGNTFKLDEDDIIYSLKQTYKDYLLKKLRAR